MRHLFVVVLLLLPLSRAWSAECVVQDEWLNMEYDHRIDYRNADIPTDFFLLVYSNSPRFCDAMRREGRAGEVPFQCNSPNSFGWVIHGLWGESREAYVNNRRDGHPRFCEGDLPKLSLETIKPYLCMSPGTRLLQGEWEKHGACDFATAKEYFDKVRQLYAEYGAPPADYSPREAVEWMRRGHPALKGKWLDISGKEFGICLDTRFKPISCPKRRRGS